MAGSKVRTPCGTYDALSIWTMDRGEVACVKAKSQYFRSEDVSF